MAESREKSEREQFEEWAVDQVDSLAKLGEVYKYADTRFARLVWKAGWEASRRDALEEAAKMVEEKFETPPKFRLGDSTRRVKGRK